MIKAVIFDMDGLLLDSEPFWKKAETEVYNSLGVPLTYELCDTTVGMKIEEVTNHWYKIYPWNTEKENQSLIEVNKSVINKVIFLVQNEGVLFDGVDYILNYFKNKNIKIAIASSSAMCIIDAVIDKFNIRGYFDEIASAENEEFGKPHPAIYLKTASLLNVNPEDCLAFEDSYNGLKSAKNAGMKTIVIPGKKLFNDSEFNIADIKLENLADFSDVIFKRLNW